MTNSQVYKWISILHSTPEIITLKKAKWLDEKIVWVYTLGGDIAYALTEEDIRFFELQLFVLQAGSKYL